MIKNTDRVYHNSNKFKPGDFYNGISDKDLILMYKLIMQNKILNKEYSIKELSDIVYSLSLRGINTDTLPYGDKVIDHLYGLRIDLKGNIYLHNGISDNYGIELISLYDIPLSLNENSKTIKRSMKKAAFKVFRDLKKEDIF